MTSVSKIVSVVLILLSAAAGAAPSPALLSTIPAPPPVAAKGWILIDHNGGTVLAENNPDLRGEIASVTKIMTAYVVFRALKGGQVHMEDEVLISKRAWKMGGSQMFVEVDTRVPFKDLLYGMIIQSGNDAAVALAEHIGGSMESFVDLMNSEAKRLGMQNSHFTKPNGLPDPEAYSSARDTAIVSSALIREFPEYYPIFAMQEFEYNSIKQYSHNKLLRRDSAIDGLKTGYTAGAGFCLSASLKRGDTRMIAVVLGAKKPRTRDADVLSLLNYGTRFYETRKLYAAQEPINEPRVWKGNSDTVPVGLAEDLLVTVPRGRSDALKASMELNPKFVAPIEVGQPLGMVRVSLDGNPLTERPIVALKAVGAGTLMQRSFDAVRMGEANTLWPWFAGVVLVGAGTFVAWPKIRRRRERRA